MEKTWLSGHVFFYIHRYIMAILCKKIGLLFIASPRTGSTSTREFLKSYYEGEEVGAYHSNLAEVSLYINIENLTKIIGVRNPYEKLISLYSKDKQAKPFDFTFGDWLKLVGPIRYKSSTREVCDGLYDKLIYFEDMQNQINEALFLCGVQNNIKLPHMNKGVKQELHYTKYYTEKIKEICTPPLISEYLDITGYVFNDIFKLKQM